MSDLQTYVDAWRQSAHAVLDLTDDLAEHEWMLSTDLPGWTVHDVVAHLAHLEAVLAGQVADTEINAATFGVARNYTESGVETRRTHSTSDIVAELRAAVAAREATLTELPTDPGAPADPTPGSVPWTWETLLRNRVVDMWCHEQDLRRALDRPGNLDSPGAQVTTRTFADAVPLVLGKRVAPASGTSVLLNITEAVRLEVGATIGEDGRAHPGVSEAPTSTLVLTSEDFCILASGRRRPEDVDVAITGDSELAHRLMESMSVTP